MEMIKADMYYNVNYRKVSFVRKIINYFACKMIGCKK